MRTLWEHIALFGLLSVIVYFSRHSTKLMDTFVRAADGAQQVRREAERNVDRRQKYQLFLKASKLYLQEIEHTNDDQIRTSLTFLASASMYEAISWSRHGSVNRSDIKSDLPSQRTKSNEENLLLNCERAIENIANKRISGLQQVAIFIAFSAFASLTKLCFSNTNSWLKAQSHPPLKSLKTFSY